MLSNLLILAVLGAAVWLALQPRYLFVICIERGRPFVSRGKVAEAFLQQVADACDRNGVDGGWIGGVRRGDRVSLVFSGGIPPGVRQQIRNEWCL